MTDKEIQKNAPEATRRRWMPSPSVLWNGLGVFLGLGLGLGAVFGTLAYFGDKTCQPYAVIAVGVGAATALGALLRMLAHFKVIPGSDVIDAAGKSIAFMAALLLVLLAYQQLADPSIAAGEQTCLSGPAEVVNQ